MMGTIRWGIIGCGAVTEVKSGPAFQKSRNSALVAVMRRTAPLAEDYARRHNVPKWYADGEALINDPEVDAVYIATPPAFHKSYTLMAASAGKPVYVEKPMALSFGECREMLEACLLADVPLYVAYYRRALNRFLKIKTLVEEGAIGAVRAVTISLYRPPEADELDPDHLPWRVLPQLAGGGRFVDLASHQLDFLDFVLGPIRSVQSFAANQASVFPAEDIVTATFMFESGVFGVGTWCFTAAEALDRTEIVGSKGRLTYATFDDSPVILTTADGTTEFALAYPPHVQQPLIQSVIDALNGERVCPSPGESAARTTWVMDQVLRSYYGAE